MSRLDAQGLPLPEIVDFRITGDKRKAIFFIREGDAYYRKHLDLTKEGAGLYCINPATGTAMLRRYSKRMSYDEVGGAAFERFVNKKFIVATVSRDMARALTFVFWGKEDPAADWPEAEGVQAAQPELVANAAD